MTSLLAGVTLAAIAMVIYHLAIWPILLPKLAKGRQPHGPPDPPDLYASDAPQDWPAIALLVPAHNEARWIKDKIANTAALDYPADRLRLVLGLDGCTDDTRAVAEATLATPECAHLRCDIVENPHNLGKLGTLNARMAEIDEPLVALSDASSVLSLDGLKLAATHFQDAAVAAVGGNYRVIEPGAEGESDFWKTQTNVKALEAALGAPMGLHGAFYVMRRKLFTPVPPDTINDDFTIPMRLVEQGHRVVYEPRIMAVELEGSSSAVDFRRRQRIGAGNMQQSLRHWRLLNPIRPGVALTFASGKGMRPLIPFAMVVGLVGALLLAPSSPLFALLASGQVAGYALISIVELYPHARWPVEVRSLHYVVMAQVASGLGGLSYLLGRHRKPWTRVSGAAS
ncbi:MAG: glycosyltransferase family 2 protein [Geminicoccaceae bacterium]